MNNLNKIKDFEVTPPVGAWTTIAKELDVWNDDKKLSTALQNCEAPPPIAAWDQISSQLDELDAFKKINQKIQALEVTPPRPIWSALRETLEEENQDQLIAKKLAHIAVPAPSMSWEAISKQLDDEQALSIIEKKLSNVQQTPPRSIWNNIHKELSEKGNEPSLVIPMHHGWLKYAAAACFVIMISVTAFFILNDDDNNSLGKYTASSSKQQPNELELSQNAQASTQPPKRSSISPEQQTLAEIRTRLGNAYSVSMEKNAELQNRYIVLMTEEGNVVRMSKKVSNMADCIAGEDNSCDEQISKWQKEMASSNTTSSPDNFLDILEMASSETNPSSSGNF